MATELASLLIGGAIGFAALAALTLNLLVLFVLAQDRFLTSRSSAFYILAFVNVISDSTRTACFAFYLAPSSISQSWLFTDGLSSRYGLLLGVVMFTTWYQAEITELVMALNRLTVIIFPEWRFLFHRRNVLVMVVVILVTSAILSATAEILMPCCTLYVYYYVFGFKYFGVGSDNYSVAYITMPLNVASSAISFVCYTTIFIFVRRVNRSPAVGTGKRAKDRKRAQEVKYAFQFAMLTVFTLIEWLVMRLFPPLVPPEYPEVYSVVIFADIIRCSANSVIFVTMNHEFKPRFIIRIKTLWMSFCCCCSCCCSSSSTQVNIHPLNSVSSGTLFSPAR